MCAPNHAPGSFTASDGATWRALQRGPKPLAILRHVHELRGNENEFDYNGRRYCWNWHRFLGGQHTLTDMDSKEVVAVGKLHFTFAWQWVTAWGFR